MADARDKLFRVCILSDNSNEFMSNNYSVKVSNFLTDTYSKDLLVEEEAEDKDNPVKAIKTIIFPFPYKMDRKYKVFDSTIIDNADIIVEISGLGFESARIKEKAMKYIEDSGRVVVKIN